MSLRQSTTSTSFRRSCPHDSCQALAVRIKPEQQPPTADTQVGRCRLASATSRSDRHVDRVDDMRAPFRDNGSQALLRDPRTRCPRATRTGARRGQHRSRRWTARSPVQRRETTQSLTLGEPRPATVRRRIRDLRRRRSGPVIAACFLGNAATTRTARSEHPVRSRRTGSSASGGLLSATPAPSPAPRTTTVARMLDAASRSEVSGSRRCSGSRACPSEHRCLRGAVPVVLGFGAASMCSSAAFTRHRC